MLTLVTCRVLMNPRHLPRKPRFQTDLPGTHPFRAGMAILK